MTTDRLILLVEDNEDDAFLMERALMEAKVTNPLQLLADGQEVINYLSGAGKYADRVTYPLPALLFLDLKLPYKSGHEVLAWIRERAEFASLVVVVLTSSAEPVDIKRCYSLGANSYLVKPPTPDELLQLAKSFNWYWLNFNKFGETNPANQ